MLLLAWAAATLFLIAEHFSSSKPSRVEQRSGIADLTGMTNASLAQLLEQAAISPNDAIRAGALIPTNLFASAFSLSHSITNVACRVTLQEVLVRRWAEGSPIQALEAITTIPDKLDQQHLVQVLAYLLSSTGFETVADYLGTTPSRTIPPAWAWPLFSGSNGSSPAVRLALARKRLQGSVLVFAETCIFRDWLLSSPAEAAEALRAQEIGTHESVFRAFTASWAVDDTDSAISWAMKLRGDIAQGAAFEGILDSLQITNSRQAIALLNKLSRRDSARLVSGLVAPGLVIVNPNEALAFLAAVPLDQKSIVASALFAEWGRRQPANALATFRRDFKRDRAAALGLMRGMAASNPREAVTWLLSREAQFVRQEALNSVVATWISSGLTNAKDFMQNQKTGKGSHEVIRVFVTLWAERDAPAATEWAIHLASDGLRDVALQALIANDPFLDLETLSAVINRLPASELRGRWMKAYAGRLASENLNSALEWANATQEGTERALVLEQIASTWGASDPAQAISYFRNLSDTNLALACVQETAKQWARSNPRDAFAWAANQQSDREQKRLTAAVLDVVRDESPRMACDLVVGLENTGLQKQCLDEVLPTFASHEPAAAAQWVTQFPDGPLREQALYDVTRRWGFDDPQAAGTWLGSLSLKDQENAIPAFVDSVDGISPELAVTWAARLTDQAKREAYIRQVLPRWAKLDMTKASAWLDTAPISDEAKSLIRPELTKPR